jgi:DNA-directed RNA polymerase I, II, and III subunit RPABC1
LRWLQGYEVSDEELAISLDDFRNKYADPMGYPEYVILELRRSRIMKDRKAKFALPVPISTNIHIFPTAAPR